MIILLFFYINLLTESVYGAIIIINRFGRNSRTEQPYETAVRNRRTNVRTKTPAETPDEPVSPQKNGRRSVNGEVSKFAR